MAKEPFEQFAMPNEVRAFVEQSVAQARVAFDGIANAANQAVAQWQGQAQAARAGASEIAHKSECGGDVRFHPEAHARQGPRRSHAAAAGIYRPADADDFEPDPRTRTKCRQNSHGRCET